MCNAVKLFAFVCLFVYLNDAVTGASIISDTHPKRLPPLEKNGAPITVTSSIYILDVAAVDDDSQTYSMQVYFRQSWKDERLKSSDENMKMLSVEESNQIWIPDTFLVEENGAKLHTLTVPNIFTRLSPDGTVFRSIRMTLNLRCRMDFRYYPHDKQTCRINIESYGHTAKEITYVWKKDDEKYRAVSISDDIELPQFSVDDLEFGEEKVEFSFGEYSRLNVELTFKRKIGYFMGKLFVPYILLVAITWLGFWIQPRYTTQRLVLVLVVLLLMIALFMDISNDITKSTYTKAIDIWTGVCISLVFAAFLTFIYVSTATTCTKEQAHSENDDKPIIVTGLDTDSEKPDKKIQINYVNMKKRFQSCSILQLPMKIDMLACILYPAFFIVFNLCYWSYYAS